MPDTNCATGLLNQYVPSADQPWNIQRAMHLYRRTGLGTDIETIKAALGRNPASLVFNLINISSNLPLEPEPEWAFWKISDYSSNEGERNQQIINQILDWGTRWTTAIKNNGLRDRMSWFWHNHFVTRQEDYGCPSWMYQYHKLLQKYALGNFKEFVREIGITPAMLVYLNNVQNARNAPNENYARELYELFTLGVDNGYTQNDIVETARAITGWNNIDVTDLCGTIEFFNFTWDPGQKTIFGRTGNWNYDDVIDILFEERAVEISEFICEKLYKEFVNPKVNASVVKELASMFRDDNFELKPLVTTLFSSEHFFDEANIGTVIPGHLEYMLTFLNEMNYTDTEELLYAIAFAASDFGQAVFNPVDVAGWPGNRAWISSSSLNFRWQSIFNIIGYYYEINGQKINEFLDLTKSLVGPSENNPEVIVEALVNYFLPKGLQFESEYEEALKVFKSEIPENYFELGQWNLDWDAAPAQIYLLFSHISNLPEYQLK